MQALRDEQSLKRDISGQSGMPDAKKTKAKNHKNSGEITVRVLTARTVVPQALGNVHCRLRNRDLKAATVLFVHPFVRRSFVRIVWELWTQF